MTAIAIPVFVKSGIDLEDAIASAEEALEPAAQAGSRGIIELRCDTATPKQMLEAIDLARVPVIVTVRPKWEGGHSDKSDDQRLTMWEEAIEAGADYIDVELVAWEKSRKIREAIEEASEKAGTRLIVSNHSFEGRPTDLEGRIERLRAVKAASVLKIAWKAESILDAVDALRITRDVAKAERKGVVALAMGEEGLLSRILAKKFGAPFTFATAEAGKESAPGQPTAADLLERYRWKVQAADTPVYGVAGWPVGHSLSPHIHNAGFEKVGFPGVFVPLAIREGVGGGYEAFAAAVDALLATVDLRGLAVTIPHKEHAFRYATEYGAHIEPLSRTLGVLNTLSWKKGTLAGMNTDYAGALDALVSAWTGNRADVRGKRVAVIGAGGAARAIVAALAAHGATVVVYNRTREKAETLVREFGGAEGGKVVAADWEKLCDSCCEAYINCTPLGMHPKVDASPIDFDPAWNADIVVFDTVYNPRRTKLLHLAEKKGAKTVPGVEMFVRQAAIQFREFTGKEADVGMFREVVEGRLGR
jgi:3-dehydroquinate dehydratase/shikimate dehydrogenase